MVKEAAQLLQEVMTALRELFRQERAIVAARAGHEGQAQAVRAAAAQGATLAQAVEAIMQVAAVVQRVLEVLAEAAVQVISQVLVHKVAACSHTVKQEVAVKVATALLATAAEVALADKVARVDQEL